MTYHHPASSRCSRPRPSREVAVLRAAVAEATELGQLGQAAGGLTAGCRRASSRAARLHLFGPAVGRTPSPRNGSPPWTSTPCASASGCTDAPRRTSCVIGHGLPPHARRMTYDEWRIRPPSPTLAPGKRPSRRFPNPGRGRARDRLAAEGSFVSRRISLEIGPERFTATLLERTSRRRDLGGAAPSGRVQHLGRRDLLRHRRGGGAG